MMIGEMKTRFQFLPLSNGTHEAVNIATSVLERKFLDWRRLSLQRLIPAQAVFSQTLVVVVVVVVVWKSPEIQVVSWTKLGSLLRLSG